jgi:antitoxin VapB
MYLHNVYTLSQEVVAVADIAKLFRSGGSQAVRIPAKYRFEDDAEVVISRDGNRIILEPRRRTWSRGFRDLAGSAPDFPEPAEPPAVEPGPELD